MKRLLLAILSLGAVPLAVAEDHVLGKVGIPLVAERGEWTPAKQAALDAALRDLALRQPEILAAEARPRAPEYTGPAPSAARLRKLERQTSHGAELFPPMDQWVELVTQNRAMERAALNGAKSTSRWNPIGLQIANADATPRAMGAIHDLQFAFDPIGNRTALHIGAMAGGLWIQRTLSIFGVIAIPVSENLSGAPTVGAFHAGGPSASPFILLGTGAPGGRGMGTGLYRSTNSGVSWTRVAMDGLHPSVFFEMKAAVNDVQRIYACTDFGLFSSANGGQTWRRKSARACSDFIEVGGSTGGVLVVAHYDGQTPRISYVLPTANNDSAWTFEATDTSGISGSVGRIALAVGTPSSATAYAYVATSNNNGNGIFRSNISGLGNWTRIAGDTGSLTGTPAQRLNFGSVMGFYANVIGVSPVDDDVVVGGMVNLFVSTNGTAATPTFSQIVSSTFDHTAVEFLPQSVQPGNTKVVFANDGGVYVYDWVTNVVGKQENARGMNVQLTMGGNNSMSQSHASRNLIGAGLWDVGSVLINQTAPISSRVTYMTGADGGAIQLSTDNAQHMAGTYGAPWSRFRSLNQGANWAQLDDGCGSNLDSPMEWPWAFTLEPTPSYGKRLYTYARTGTDPNFSARIVRQNLDDPNCSWTPLHAGSLPITLVNRDGDLSLQVANDPSADRVYVADGGPGAFRAYRLTGAAPSMTIAEITPTLSAPTIGETWLTADRNPGRPATVYVAARLNTLNLQLMLSNSGGAFWSDVTGDLNRYAFGAAPFELIANPNDLNELFVTTAIGVFRSNDRGTRWRPYNEGLPVSPYGVNLEFDATQSPPRLILGTYGRGFYSREVAPLDDVIFDTGFEPLPPPLG
jgi:hypothetical protein